MMKKLNLNFLDNPYQVDQPNLIAILEGFGKEISDYAKDYFSYIITSTNVEDVLTDFTLFIIAPEIAYEYRVINVEIINIKELRITFFTLITKQTQKFDVDISKGTDEYENKLKEILSYPLFNASLKFLVDQINLKHEYSDEVRGKIVIGQARVAKLKTGEQINVGFQRIEGDKVYYYTGKGLRLMFKPNMTDVEKMEANRLKKLSEEDQIKEQLLAWKKISDFEDIE
jgi:hypothetical protein